MLSVTTCKIATMTLAISFAIFSDPFVVAQERQPDFPYQAMVIAKDAKVHSGPDSVHYSTDELKLDSIVEVHRHDPGGWCAIRPPAGSFSLVPESVVNRVSDYFGVITESEVQAWVGTRLGTVEVPLWQVKLRQDEEVEILGEVSWPNPEGYSTIWYQIAAPPGEFRWIRISDLRLPKNLNALPEAKLKKSKSPATKIANQIPASIPRSNVALGNRSGSPIQQSSYQSADSEPILAEPTFDEFDEFDQIELDLNPPSGNAETVNRGWRQASRSVRVADNRREYNGVEPFKTPALDAPVIGAGQIPQTRSRNRNASNGSTTKRNAAVADATQLDNLQNGAADSFVPVTPISGPVSDRIRKLELQLTTELQKPPAQWNLESMLRQSTSIASTTNNGREREHAQRLQQKVRNCASIQSRYGSAFSNKPVASPVSKPVPRVSDIQLGATYDAHGWLNRLVRENERLTPTYVLEDENGKITHHIGASPGLNLQRYLKQKVGVIGRRGFHRNLGLNHVTAERVVVINKVR